MSAEIDRRIRGHDHATDRTYAREMTYQPDESVIDRLIEALAAQVAAAPTGALVPEAAEALAELSRTEASVIFGCAGHLVHYDAIEPVQMLIHLISGIQRDEALAEASIVAGDRVRLVGDLPPSLAKQNERILRETVFVVRFVGDDETVDVQPDLAVDYVIETVPTVNVTLEQ
jgi:hypothetical protein